MFIYTATEAWFCGFAKRLRRGLLRKWLMQKFKLKEWIHEDWHHDLCQFGQGLGNSTPYVHHMFHRLSRNRFAHTTWGCGREVSSCFIFHVMPAVPLHGCMCVRASFFAFFVFAMWIYDDLCGLVVSEDLFPWSDAACCRQFSSSAVSAGQCAKRDWEAVAGPRRCRIPNYIEHHRTIVTTIPSSQSDMFSFWAKRKQSQSIQWFLGSSTKKCRSVQHV